MTMLGLKHSPETIKKMKQNHKGMSGKKHSKKSRRKISNSLLGNKRAQGHSHIPWNKGKGISREIRSTPEFQREFYRKNNRKYYKRKRAWIDKIKDVPCVDCGKKFPPYVMDFDHVRGKKKFQISSGFQESKEVLLEEMKKCDIVCANCHRIRTYKSVLLRKRKTLK